HLATVVNFVFYHGAEPFPCRQLRSRGCHTVALQIFGSQTLEHLNGLDMTSPEKLHDGVISIGETSAAPWIPTPVATCVFGKHVAFDRGDVANSVAEREEPFFRCPLDPIRWNLFDDALRPLSHTFVVTQERLNIRDLHKKLLSRASLHKNSWR